MGNDHTLQGCAEKHFSRNYRRPISTVLDTLKWEPLLTPAQYPDVPDYKRQYPFRHYFGRKDVDRYRQYKASAKANEEVTSIAEEYLSTMALGTRGPVDMVNIGYTLALSLHCRRRQPHGNHRRISAPRPRSGQADESHRPPHRSRKLADIPCRLSRPPDIEARRREMGTALRRIPRHEKPSRSSTCISSLSTATATG